eukprot:2109844-Rhodomonas_salina.1
MLVRQQEAAWEGGWHDWEEAREEEEAVASKRERSPGLPFQPSLRRSPPPVAFPFFTHTLSLSLRSHFFSVSIVLSLFVILCV